MSGLSFIFCVAADSGSSCFFFHFCRYNDVGLFQKLPNFIVNIITMGARIVVSDIQESFHFVKYRNRENQLVVFADDVNPR